MLKFKRKLSFGLFSSFPNLLKQSINNHKNYFGKEYLFTNILIVLIVWDFRIFSILHDCIVYFHKKKWFCPTSISCSKSTLQAPKKFAIFPKLTVETPERHQWLNSGVFIVDFEHISNIVLVSPMKTLNM